MPATLHKLVVVVVPGKASTARPKYGSKTTALSPDSERSAKYAEWIPPTASYRIGHEPVTQVCRARCDARMVMRTAGRHLVNDLNVIHDPLYGDLLEFGWFGLGLKINPKQWFHAVNLGCARVVIVISLVCILRETPAYFFVSLSNDLERPDGATLSHRMFCPASHDLDQHGIQAHIPPLLCEPQ